MIIVIVSNSQLPAANKKVNHYQVPVHQQDCKQKKHYITCHMKFCTIYCNFTNPTLYAVQLNVDLILMCTILTWFPLISHISCSHVICHTWTKMTHKCTRATWANPSIILDSRNTAASKPNVAHASLIMSINKSIETVLNINLTCKFCAKYTQFYKWVIWWTIPAWWG